MFTAAIFHYDHKRKWSNYANDIVVSVFNGHEETWKTLNDYGAKQFQNKEFFTDFQIRRNIVIRSYIVIIMSIAIIYLLHSEPPNVTRVNRIMTQGVSA